MLPFADVKVRRAETVDRPLFAAIERRDLPAVRAALRAGSSPNAYVTDGETVLMRAAKAGCVPIALALFRAGANPNTLSMWGFNAIDAARWNEKVDPAPMVSVLLRAGVPPSRMAAWGYSDRPKVLRFLIAAKAPIDATALNRAIEDDSLDSLRMMLRANAPVNGAGTGGYPLHVAAAHGKLRAVKLLLLFGARRDLRDRSGLTAGQVAQRTGNGPVASLLGTTAAPLPRLDAPDLRQASHPFATGFSHVHDYAWQPDGGLVLWCPVVTGEMVDETQSLFTRFDPKGRRLSAWKSSVGLDESSRLSPDGSRMAWTESDEVLAREVDGGDPHAVSTRGEVGPLFWTSDSKSWSVLVWNNRSGGYDGIYWRDGRTEPLASDTGVRPLGDEIDPTWVLNRNHVRTVKFFRDTKGEQDRSRGTILATSLTPKGHASEIGRFSPPREGSIEEAAFSLDGHRIAWIVTLPRDHRVGIWTTQADGSQPRLLGTIHDDSPPSYGVLRDVWIHWRLESQPHHLRWTPTGGLSFVLGDTLRTLINPAEAR